MGNKKGFGEGWAFFVQDGVHGECSHFLPTENDDLRGWGQGFMAALADYGDYRSLEAALRDKGVTESLTHCVTQCV